MSISCSAEVIVGMRLPYERLWKESHDEPAKCSSGHTNAIDSKFCSECGSRLTMKTVRTPWPGQSHTELFGFPIVWIGSGEADGVVLCAAQLAFICTDEMIEKLTDVDVEHLKRRMIEKLEPHGLWDPNAFGTWLVNTSCW